MTAITVTEFTKEDFPGVLVSGTSSKRARIYLRYTTTTADNTLDLTSLDANIADVEGVVYGTAGGVATSDPTWSTYTVTEPLIGAIERCIVVTYN